METFQEWVSRQHIEYEEYRKLTYKQVLHVMEVPLGIQISQDMDYIEFLKQALIMLIFKIINILNHTKKIMKIVNQIINIINFIGKNKITLL